MSNLAGSTLGQRGEIDSPRRKEGLDDGFSFEATNGVERAP